MAFYLFEDLEGYQRFDVPADLALRAGGTIGGGEWMELKPLSEKDIEVAALAALSTLAKLAAATSVAEQEQPIKDAAISVTDEDPMNLSDPTVTREPPLTRSEAVERLGSLHVPSAVAFCCRAWSFKLKTDSEKQSPITPETCARLPASVRKWAYEQIAILTTPLAKATQDFVAPPSDAPSDGGDSSGAPPEQI